MLDQIAKHMKRLGPQRDCLTCPVKGAELGIEETIREEILHGAIRCAGRVYQKPSDRQFAGKLQLEVSQPNASVGCVSHYTISDASDIAHIQRSAISRLALIRRRMSR